MEEGGGGGLHIDSDCGGLQIDSDCGRLQTDSDCGRLQTDYILILIVDDYRPITN